MARATTDKRAPIKGIDALRSRDMRWYLETHEADRAKKLTAAAKATRQNDDARRRNFERYHALYSNLPVLGLSPRRYTQQAAEQTKDKLSINVVRSCCDSFVAKLTNQKTAVSCITTGADWDVQQRAECLETFLGGMFYETDFYGTAPLVALDCAEYGTGTLKIYADDIGEAEHIVLERIHPLSTWVDDVEAYNGKPRTRYQGIEMDRLVAMALWPEAAEELATVTNDNGDPNDAALADNRVTDTIRIVEAWHLPSCAGANDGRHSIACGEVLILDEPWTKDYFPFVDLYRQRPANGIWGTGLAEELMGLQFEINTILNTIRKAMRMSGTLRWMVENGSNVNTQYISDIIGSIIRFTGTAPAAVTPPVVAPEVYEQLRWLITEAYQITGVSELSATGTVPGSEESGKAKEIRLDTESERFSVAFDQYHHFFLKAARQIIALAREIGERNPSFKVKAVAKGKMMETVQWADIHLEDEQYVLQLVETNAFAKSPSARMQQITDWLNAGALDPKTARRLIDGIPDLKEEESLEYASFNLTMDMITDILKSGSFQPPEPFMNLDESIQRFTWAYCKARRSKVAEDKLELMRRWITMANDMKPKPPMPGPPPNAPPPPHPPPPAAPMPMPQAA